MSIISFGWTTAALLAGCKTVTRRDWVTRHARQFEQGDRVQAYNRSPRNGGHQVAMIKLTHNAYQEPLNEAPDADYEGEGFAFYEDHPELVSPRAPWPQMHPGVWEGWKATSKIMWVVRFELLEVLR